MDNKNKIWKSLFYVLLGFHALYQLNFGLMTVINPQSLEALFDFQYQATSSSFLLVLILAFGQFFLAAMSVLSIYWTRKHYQSGIILGIALGFYFLLLGISGIALADGRIVLYIDVIRGALTVLFGFIILTKTKNI